MNDHGRPVAHCRQTVKRVELELDTSVQRVLSLQRDPPTVVSLGRPAKMAALKLPMRSLLYLVTGSVRILWREALGTRGRTFSQVLVAEIDTFLGARIRNLQVERLTGQLARTLFSFLLITGSPHTKKV